MKIRSSLVLVLILFVSMFVLWGCPKKAEVTAVPEAQQETAAAPDKDAADKAAEDDAEARARAEAEARERAAAEAQALQPVYFDFDQAFIRSDDKSVIKANADWLKANPKSRVKIEGNTDERGTAEYNQALGQRRASSVKKYLTDLGIAGNRISIISYGKEKPVCSDPTEDCWQKNRRADFVAGE